MHTCPIAVHLLFCRPGRLHCDIVAYGVDTESRSSDAANGAAAAAEQQRHARAAPVARDARA